MWDPHLHLVRILSALAVFVVHCACGTKQFGHWAAWEAPSPCTVTCGSGVQTQLRRWVMGRDDPPHKAKQTYTRNYMCSSKKYKECPVDGKWTDWFNWSGCSKACGRGVRQRTRYCYPPRHGGRKCMGHPQQREDCTKAPCPRLPPNFNLTQCTSQNFTCGSTKMCVPRRLRCDGKVHCHDGTDEEDCSNASRAGSYEIRYGLSIGGSGADHHLPDTILTSLSLILSIHLFVCR